MAAPSYQAQGARASGTSGTISPAWPTHQADDIGLLIVETSSTQAPTLDTPAGFVQTDGSPQDTTGGAAGSRLTAYWCRATSSAMTAPVIADSGNHTQALIVTYRGCAASGDPWNVAAGSAKTSASTTTTWPDVTTTVADTLVVQIASMTEKPGTDFWSGHANAALSSITERYDAATTDGAGGSINIIDGTKASAGSVGNTTATITVSRTDATITIALQGPVASLEYFPRITRLRLPGGLL